MPLYNYQCKHCKRRFEALRPMSEREFAICRKCGGFGEQKLSAPAVINFRAGWYDHVGPEPVYCETAQQLQDACNEHGGVSVYLEGSPFRIRRDYDDYYEKQDKQKRERLERDERARQGDPSLLPE